MKHQEKLLYLIIGVFALSVMFWYGIKWVVLPPDNATVIYNWTVKDTTGHVYTRREDRSIPKILSQDIPPGIFVYTATVELPLLTGEGTDYALVISHPAFQAFRVYIDGVLVGSVGDMASGRSNIWNGVFYFPIDRSFLDKDTLSVEIRGYALYIHGFDIEPFITSMETARRYFFVNRLFTDRVYNWAIGASLTVGFSLLVLIMLSRGVSNKKYPYFALASLFAAIFYMDYTVIDCLPVPYILYKKVIILSAMLATYFIHNGVLAVVYGNEKKPRSAQILSALVWVAAVIDLIVGYDMVQFKKIYAYVNLIIPLVFVYDAVVLFSRYSQAIETGREMSILLFGMVANSFFVVIDIYQLVREIYTSGYTILISTYGLMIFILAMNFALIYDYILVYRRAMRQERTVRELKDISQKDSLTGAYNRSYMSEILPAVHGDVCFLMLDIDHFKRVNDTYGHTVGDKVLKHIVSVINMQVRSGDIVIRYGGEEFIIILFDTEMGIGKVVAERIRQAVESSIIIASGYEVHVTVSIGVCCGFIGEDITKEAIWQYIHKADEYLYIAKESGRNKVVAGECPTT